MSVPGPDPAAVVAAVEGRARRVETPCGDGAVVWRIWGDDRADVPPVVLSHGAQGAWSHWIRNIDVLAADRMVIAVDVPGHGDSALPPTPDHAGISAALAAGLPHVVGNGRKVDLAGFSFGGVCFAWLARQYPDLVRRLIIVGCGGLGTPHGHIDVRPARGLDGEARRAVLKGNLLGLMLHHDASVDDLAIHLLQTNARKARLVAPDLVVPDKLLRALDGMAVPVDAIWGERDRPHPDPAAQAAALRHYQPDADFRVVADAGHWVMYERTEAFNATLLDMLRQPLRAMP